MIHACGERGCDVLTMGEFCVEHEYAHALIRHDVSLAEALTPAVIFKADRRGVPAGTTAVEAAHQHGRGGPLIPT